MPVCQRDLQLLTRSCGFLSTCRNDIWGASEAYIASPLVKLSSWDR